MNSYNEKFRIIEMYGLLLLDILCITVSYAIAYLLRFQGAGTFTSREIMQIYLPFLLICMLNSFFTDEYKRFFQRGYYYEFLRVLRYNLVLFIVTGFYIYVFRLELEFSRLLLGYFVAINIVITYLVRVSFKQIMTRYYKKGRGSDKIMVITTNAEIDTVIQHIEQDSGWSYEIIGMAVMDADKKGETVRGIPVIANRDDVIEAARLGTVDVAFFHCPRMANLDLEVLIQSFLAMGIICHNCVERFSINTPCSSTGKFAGFPVTTYAINVIDYRRMIIKRAIDIVGGSIGLLATLILLPFVAIAIKADSKGPVIFSQIRIGKNGRRFKMYKFRSMYVDAEARKEELMKQNEVQGPMFKMDKDPRVTRTGHFLRKTSIDELPQFWNVVRGDMSLVGTRPPTEKEFEQYNIYYRRRLSITPGLTGLWQISGRNNIKNFEDVVKLDLKYIDEWSLLQDVKIILQTVKVVLFRTGAK